MESVFEELDGEFSENICDGGEGKSEEGKDVEAEDREDAAWGMWGLVEMFGLLIGTERLFGTRQ